MQYLWIIFLGLAAIVGFLNDVTDLSKKEIFNKVQLTKEKSEPKLNFDDSTLEKPVLDDPESERIYNAFCEKNKSDKFCE